MKNNQNSYDNNDSEKEINNHKNENNINRNNNIKNDDDNTILQENRDKITIYFFLTNGKQIYIDINKNTKFYEVINQNLYNRIINTKNYIFL